MIGQRTQVRWDLRHSHTKKDVQWTDSLDAREVARVDLTVQLPGGHTFDGKDVTVRMASDGPQVTLVAIFFQPATLDDAYRHAKQLAHDWQLNASALDAWFGDVQAGRKQGVKDRDVRFPVALSGPALGPDGPTLYSRIVYSFDESKAGLLDFELQWT